MTIERLGTLARTNRALVFFVTLAVVLLGLFVPGLFGGAILLLLAAALVALLSRTWRVTPRSALAIRLIILTALVVFALVKITG